MTVPQALAEEHYSEHTDKPFYGKLISFITQRPVLQWLSKVKSVDVSRHIIGKTNPSEATPGSIRGDLGLTVGRNVIHGSDSVESQKRD